MHALDAVQEAIRSLMAVIARPRQAVGFVCGECERWQRCGSPPDKRCIVMAAQIARDEGRASRRAKPAQWFM